MTDLSSLLSDLTPDTVPSMQVSGFALDNRKIYAGMVFVALNGTQQHGMGYAKAAVEQGAVAVVYEPDGVSAMPELTVPVIRMPGLAEQLGLIADRFYQSPSRELSVVGVTGTDGKTSVTQFVAEISNLLGQQAAVTGTIGSGRPGNLLESTHTTTDAITTHQRLRELVDSDFDTVAMEVSSHALDQGRVGSVAFDVAVLTNLTRDHLDYHGTLDAYAEAKRQLFLWASLKAVVLNLDDAFGKALATELRDSGIQVIGYGTGQADVYPAGTLVANDARFDHNGLSAQLTSAWGVGELKASVLGRFNLENLLAACGVMLALGHELSDVLEVLSGVQTVPGRMERVQQDGVDKDVLVVVDYAHTAGALESVLQAVRVHTRKQLICVFGCGGDRDVGKRPLMAAVAEQDADRIIVTDDNPRTEDAEQIFTDIRGGFVRPEAVQFEHSRAVAIRNAIGMAQTGDAVLIAGKGHETVQVVNQEMIPFDDRQQARQVLQELAA